MDELSAYVRGVSRSNMPSRLSAAEILQELTSPHPSLSDPFLPMASCSLPEGTKVDQPPSGVEEPTSSTDDYTSVLQDMSVLSMDTQSGIAPEHLYASAGVGTSLVDTATKGTGARTYILPLESFEHPYQHPHLQPTNPISFNTQAQVSEADRIARLLEALRVRLVSGVGPRDVLERHYVQLRRLYLDILEGALLC
ncbi:hypothetical protein GMRT_10143 [Giardia muris]|uniref:Uncharacterized protein n=1 Tax=Giardia muris TaxID=5742 RepID=A0A4Z1ST13_GIAMU|nr:hypothetical protein GMRT_10143 [Giardia muris]|eukprot:TNJ26788.1 hypothetical protein GMRT_10143 [Giardia muris]